MSQWTYETPLFVVAFPLQSPHFLIIFTIRCLRTLKMVVISGLLDRPFHVTFFSIERQYNEMKKETVCNEAYYL